MKTPMRMAATAAAMVLLGGCAINLLGGTPDTPNALICMEDAIKKAKSDLDARVKTFKDEKMKKIKDSQRLQSMVSAYREVAENIRSLKQVDEFLNCYIGPEEGTLVVSSGSKPSENDKKKARELSLLRGHMIVTLLARYGALNVTGQFGKEKIEFSTYEGLNEDAADIITSIRRAEGLLRIGSSINEHQILRTKILPNDPTTSIPFPESVKDGALEQFRIDDKRDRVLAVSKLLIDVETPTFERAKNWFLNLFSLVQAPTISKGRQALKDAANGFKKLSVVSRFRNPYFKGIRKQLTDLRGRDITFAHWKEWDDFMAEACTRIQERASSLETCIP